MKIEEFKALAVKAGMSKFQLSNDTMPREDMFLIGADFLDRLHGLMVDPQQHAQAALNVRTWQAVDQLDAPSPAHQQGGELPQDERSKFEAWVRNEWILCPSGLKHADSNLWAEPALNDMWDCWQAALAQRAAPAVELPQDERAHRLLACVNRAVISLRDGWGDRNDANEAIKSLAEIKEIFAQRAPSVPAQAVQRLPDGVSLRAFQAADDKSWWIEIKHPFGSTNKHCTQYRDVKLAQLMHSAPVPAASVPDAGLVEVGTLFIAQDESRIPAFRWPGPSIAGGEHTLYVKSVRSAANWNACLDAVARAEAKQFERGYQAGCASEILAQAESKPVDHSDLLSWPVLVAAAKEVEASAVVWTGFAPLDAKGCIQAAISAAKKG